MKTEIKYLIADLSYAFMQGLKSILQQLGNRQVYTCSSAQRLIESVQKIKPDVFILNKKLYIDIENEIKNVKKEIGFSIIFLSEKKTDDDNGRDIFYYDSKDEIIKKIQEKLPQFFDSEKKDSILSKREKDIVREIALGLSNKEISEKLFISIHTVTTHRKNITQKLDIKSVAGLTVYAILNHLVNTDEI